MLKSFIQELVNAPGNALVVSLPGSAPTGRRAWLGAGGFTTGAFVMYGMDDGTQQEHGIGQITAGTPSTLTRTSPKMNSVGTQARLNFQDTTRVYCALIPELAVYRDQAGKLSQPSEVMGSPFWAGTSAGSSTAYTVTLVPAPEGYVGGMRVAFRAHAACGVSPTIAVNALGVKSLKRIINGRILALQVNDIRIGGVVEAIYDETDGNFIVVSQVASLATWSFEQYSQSAGAQSAVNFALPSTAFDQYELEIESAVPTAAGVPYMRISVDGGATYLSGASDYTNAAGQMLAAAVTAQGGTAAQMNLGPSTLHNSFLLMGKVRFRSASVKMAMTDVAGMASGPVPYRWAGTSICTVAGTPTDIQFGFLGTTVANHRIRLVAAKFD